MAERKRDLVFPGYILLVLGLVAGFLVGRYNEQPTVENCSNVILSVSKR